MNVTSELAVRLGSFIRYRLEGDQVEHSLNHKTYWAGMEIKPEFEIEFVLLAVLRQLADQDYNLLSILVGAIQMSGLDVSGQSTGRCLLRADLGRPLASVRNWPYRAKTVPEPPVPVH
jgi:hypothetical protein